MTPAEIQALLAERFDEQILAFDLAQEPGKGALQPRVDVDPPAFADVCRVLRDDCGFERLLCVSGVDHEGYDSSGRGKHIDMSQYEEDGSVRTTPPGKADLSVVVHLHSRATDAEIAVAATVPREDPRVPTLTEIWATADWGERETYDLFGIEFIGHPDLRRILLPEDWEGYPLRKDYQMPTVYHDVPLEGAPLAVWKKRERE